jgi:hypothetical protein
VDLSLAPDQSLVAIFYRLKTEAVCVKASGGRGDDLKRARKVRQVTENNRHGRGSQRAHKLLLT